jgi:hypothetical protein
VFTQQAKYTQPSHALSATGLTDQANRLAWRDMQVNAMQHF